MRSTSFLALTVFLVFVTLVAGKRTKEENPVKGYSLVQDSVKGRIKGRGQVQHLIQVQGQAKRKAKGKHQVPAKANKRGACPTILTHCTVLNPPNLCHSDTECPGAKKCCAGHCGMTCLEPQ
ncbi:elafin-like [Trichechus manatus latirostris]|uniref:Elafin-like n=1 Tax=Trichechus manatus latirostris TaxID=127582 RepID=A0A2Y9G0H1_TRIMA|nr:elafin-like [Trichechus manatus latirostris]